MFGSTILDVAIGLIFTFLVISLAAGSIIEAGASLTRWRSRMLLNGVKTLLNNQDVVNALYKHALINPRSLVDGSGDLATGFLANRRTPAYINSKQFAAAFMDVVGLSSAIAKGSADVATLTGAVSSKFGSAKLPSNQSNASTSTTDPIPIATPIATAAALPTVVPGALAKNQQIEDLLHGIIERSLGDPATIKAELADWFDNGMDRVSGVYKRWTQSLSLIIALLVAVALNVDSIRIARELWAQPVLVEKIKADKQITDIPGALSQMTHTIPVGWPNGQMFMKSVDGSGQTAEMKFPDYLMAILGWIITALATLFGAPFWFDALQSVTRLKGAGPSPAEKASGRAAAA